MKPKSKDDSDKSTKTLFDGYVAGEDMVPSGDRFKDGFVKFASWKRFANPLDEWQ